MNLPIDPIEKPRLASALVVSLAPLFLCVACVQAGTTPGSQAPSSTASAQESIVAMGQGATTNAGNTVTIFSYTAPLSTSRSPGSGMMFVAADVKACAGPRATQETGVTRAQFAVQTPNLTLWPSVATVKTPALPGGNLKPNQCVRGWITFRVPLKPKAQYVVLVSRPLIKWRIP